MVQSSIHLHPSIARAKKLAQLLDSAFTIPVIKKKVGLDPVLGLIPGGGDAIAAILALYPLWVAYQLGLPNPVLIRMGTNVILDILVGAIPVVGDVADIFWKANTLNIDLLEKAWREQSIAGDGPVIDVQAKPI